MRPKGLTAICIIGIILAGLGFISVSGGLLWWIAGNRFFETMSQLGSLNPQQAQLQETMMHEVVELQQRWAPFTIALTILQAVLVVLLLVAAIKGLRMRKGAGRLLATTMAFAILLELARIYPNYMLQQGSQEINTRYQNTLMQTGGNAPRARAAFTVMKQAQQVTMVVTYLIMGSWVIAKLGYYGTALWYVNRKDVRLLFEPEAETAAVSDGS